MSPDYTRRGLLGTFGGLGLAVAVGGCGEDATEATTATATPTATATAAADDSATGMLDAASRCTIAPETTQGPYYFDADRVRGDLREDRQGVVMRLALRVQSGEACDPVRDAVVSLWHCDAEGVYSGFESASTGDAGGSAEAPAGGGGVAPGGAPPDAVGGSGGADSEATPTDDERYLRGEQITDSGGVVEFTTIYPGWYRGRAVHAHLKVILDNSTAVTSQLFFPEDFSDTVYTQAPYSAHGERDTRIDSGDMVYTQADAEGTPLLLTLRQHGDEVLAAGNIVIAG